MTQSVEEMHSAVRGNRSTAFAELMDKVYDSMSPLEIAPLPRRYPEDIGEYVNALVGHALYRLSELGEDLKRAVAGTFEQSPKGERFIFDPLRGSKREPHCLFLNADGELVTVRNPRLGRDRGSGDLILDDYHSYEVLTGPQAGSTFSLDERALPSSPELKRRPEPIAAALTAAAPSSRFADFLAQAPLAAGATPRGALPTRLFLSYSSKDKPLAQRIERRLSSRGFSVWRDDNQMLPGDVLPETIRTAIRASTHFLPLLTDSAAASKWVAQELAFAREGFGLTIIPLLASAEAVHSLTDEVLGVSVVDTTRLEEALDVLCKRIAPETLPDTRERVATAHAAAAIRAENPILWNLDLTAFEARHDLDTLSPDNVNLHAIEAFFALEYDLAILDNVTDEKLLTFASNVAAVFGRVGAGTYPLQQFIKRCDDSIVAHRVFTPFTGERLGNPTLIPTVMTLFEACRPPHHTVLTWFVHNNLDRLSKAQKRWAISHFIKRASSPENDALITACVFLELMPHDTSLVDLLNRWINSGKIGCEGDTLHLDAVNIYFRCMNHAAERHLAQFEPTRKTFHYCFRGAARGRTLPEVLAAARMLLSAKREHYVGFKELLAELSDAPYTAEWKSLGPPESFTRAFSNFAIALEQEKDEVEAYIRLVDAT